MGANSWDLHLHVVKTWEERSDSSSCNKLQVIIMHKKRQLIPQPISTGSWCSPTFNSNFLFWFLLHLDSFFMTNWKSHVFPGTLKLLPSKVSLLTCWRHNILTKAPYQKQSEQKLAWQVSELEAIELVCLQNNSPNERKLTIKNSRKRAVGPKGIQEPTELS